MNKPRLKIMTDIDEHEQVAEIVSPELGDLKPKKPTNRAPQGIRTVLLHSSVSLRYLES